MNTVDEILDYAIDQEQQAADFYADLAQRAEKAGMKEILLDFCRRGTAPQGAPAGRQAG